MGNIDSYAEQQALKALHLNSFKGFDLDNAKSVLADMLSHIRDREMFSEYTQHDISHVNGMLKLLDFIIPDKTKLILSSADWMMIVLSCYFHDLGMLITNEEYENRETNIEFQNYLKNLNLEDINKNISEDKLNQSIYQDFVRQHHGDRIFEWINSISDIPEKKNPVVKLLYDILHNVDEDFRGDLACICRSHQEDLVTKTSSFNTSTPYEQYPDSTVNLLYVAALLRTADLLHVNSERTPAGSQKTKEKSSKSLIIRYYQGFLFSGR